MEGVTGETESEKEYRKMPWLIKSQIKQQTNHGQLNKNNDKYTRFKQARNTSGQVSYYHLSRLPSSGL